MTKRDELIALADFIRDGTLEIIHCGSALGAVDASKKQRDAIEVALRLAAQSPEPVVRVNELRWYPVDNRPATRAEALSAIGLYIVADLSGDGRFAVGLDNGACAAFLLDEAGDKQLRYATIDEAKSAAQADYERRVLSALEAPAAGSNFDGYDVRFHENVLGQLGATTKSDGDEPSSRTAGGFPVAAAPYHAEETGVIQPTRERAGIERGMDQGVTGGESATTNSSPSEPKNYFFENEEDAAEAADNGRNTGGKSYYRPSDPSSTRSEVTVRMLASVLLDCPAGSATAMARSLLEQFEIRRK